VIEAIPAVKSKSAAAAPGIATGPRSVVQVPMTGNVATVTGGVSASMSVFPAGDSDPCHAPDESWVHGVHETSYPDTPLFGIQGR
jgi:hypothetical protein